MKIRNTFIIFIVSGFWHGANWTFVVWGALNALYFLPLLLLNKNRVNTNLVAEGKYFPSFRELFQMTTTFFITLIAWIFFRADNVTNAFIYIKNMFTANLFTKPEILPMTILGLLIFFLAIEWLGRSGEYAIQKVDFLKKPIRWSFYFFLVILIFSFTGEQQEFIYFQF